jgi:hypothetical protein
MIGCWMAVCVAAGLPVFGHRTYQGPVLMVDEETPKASLEYHLDRFCQGLGVKRKNLPIYVKSMTGFRFDRRTMMKELIDLVDLIEPVFIRMDSLLAMMPSGRQRLSENSDGLGEIVRDDLNQLLRGKCSILLSAHSKKYIAELPLDELAKMEMQSIVRGHSSIVGEGCDTGYIVKKISEHPDPTIFCILTKVRRQSIPAGHIKYIEMVEETYGKGWARLDEIPPAKMPPTEWAKEMYKLFKVPDNRGNYTHNSSWVRRTCAFTTAKECKRGVMELLDRHVLTEVGPQHYELNQKRGSQCDPDYLRKLELK